jgi:DNA helicase HerA-like ATPase
MWRTSAHLATGDDAALNVVGHLLLGALRGDGSHLEPLRLVPYTQESMQVALASLRDGMQPRIGGPAHPVVPGAEQPETLLTSEELGRWLGIPSHDLPGLPAREVAHFGRGGRGMQEQRLDPMTLPLGPLVYGGRVSAFERVGIPMTELCGHAFVAGTTGAGKTTTIREILRGLAERSIPFIVLEPAKSEYLDLFEELRSAGHRPIRFELSPILEAPDVQPLRLNPFAAPAGLPLGRHIEALKILLRSCFEMQESLPQLLERVLFDVYQDRGWNDLVKPVTEAEIATRGFPTFSDFLEPVVSRRTAAWSRIQRAVAQFQYEDRVEKNLVAALTVRMQSFLRGLKGNIFVQEERSFTELLQRPCFINLSDINEPDIRRFLLSSLFLRLYAERAAESRLREIPGGLRHLIVLEEAHHFLRKTSSEGPGSNLVRESNTLLADAFAEFRAYGQGILVADQAPGELDQAVLRNTNVKIVHRLFQEADVVAMAEAIGLNEDNRGELRRLGAGECVVFSPSLQHSVVCRVSAKE